MPSVQDIETRLGIIERKVALIMKAASVTKITPSTLVPGETIKEQMTLEDLYREVVTSGVDLNG